MAYIGQGIKQGTFKVLDTSGNTYNGSNTTFNLGTQVGSAAQLLVSHDGVIQKPGTDYTLASGGASITFSTAPASGASIFITEISGAVGGTVTPSDTSVTADKLNTALLTGHTDIGAGIADADLFLVDDGAGGTLRKTAASRIKTYAGFSVSDITGATALGAEPATTDEFVLSDAGTLKRVDYSHIRGSKVLLATASRTSGSVSQVQLTDFMDSTKYISYIAHISFKNAGNGNNQFFNFTSSGGSTMEATNYYGAGNALKNANGTISNNTREIATNENKVSWVASASTRLAFMEFVMHPIGVTTDSGVSTVFFRGQTDRWTGSTREPQYVTGAAYYINSTVPTGFVIGASGGNWERYEIAVYGLKKA